MNNTNYVYLAGPIQGITYNEATDWRTQAKDKFPWWIRTLSPMRGKEYLKGHTAIRSSYEDSIMSSAKAINTRDYNDVKRSSALLVNFLGATKVSIGTVMEIAWAKVFRIPIVCVMEKNNIHRHIMLEDACGFVVPDLQTGIDVITQLLGDDNQVEDYNNPPKKVAPETVKGSDNDIDKAKIKPEKTLTELLTDFIKEMKVDYKDMNPQPNPFINLKTSRTGDAYPWYNDFYTIN